MIRSQRRKSKDEAALDVERDQSVCKLKGLGTIIKRGFYALIICPVLFASWSIAKKDKKKKTIYKLEIVIFFILFLFLQIIYWLKFYGV
jgi:uncharacterized membrane protein